MGISAAAVEAEAAAAMFGSDDGDRGRSNGEDEHEYDLVMPGFRFHPTEDELVEFYLRRKVEGRRFNVELITFLDLYRYDPWELPAMATIGEKEWYFYVPRDRKYRNGDRPNRVTTSGYWKATGADRVIRSENGMRSIGLKKTLVFYAGKAPKGIRSSWIMNEYRLPHADTAQYQIRTEISLCRVHKRSGVEDSSQIAGTLLTAACRPTSRANTSDPNKKTHSSFASSSSSSRRQPPSAVGMIAKLPKPSSGALSIYGGGGGSSVASLSSTTSMEEDSCRGHPMRNCTLNHLTASAAAASAITDYYSASGAAPAALPGIEELVNFNTSGGGGGGGGQIAPPLNQQTMSLPMISEKLWEWWNPLPEVGN